MAEEHGFYEFGYLPSTGDQARHDLEKNFPGVEIRGEDHSKNVLYVQVDLSRNYTVQSFFHRNWFAHTEVIPQGRCDKGGCA